MNLYIMKKRRAHCNWELVPQESSLIAEGSACHSTFADFRDHKEACNLKVQSFSGAMGHSDLVKI